MQNKFENEQSKGFEIDGLVFGLDGYKSVYVGLRVEDLRIIH
jgi:hypothetical protein